MNESGGGGGGGMEAAAAAAVSNKSLAETPVCSIANSEEDKQVVDMEAVLAFLKNKGLDATEATLRRELSRPASDDQRRKSMTPLEGAAAAAKNPVAAAATATVGGGGCSASDDDVGAAAKNGEVSNVLSSYKSEGDPGVYADTYRDLQRFVDSSLDLYRHELALVLYPVFVHMYLELVYNGHEAAARAFVAAFGPQQEPFHQGDIKKLSYITKREHMKGSELMENFRTSQFTVRMSRDTYTQLRQQRKYMAEKKHSILWTIISEHLYLDVYEGIARNKQQIVSTVGGMVGEANRQANRSRLFYGLLKEPDLSSFGLFDEEEDEADEKGDKPKKKKIRRDMAQLKKQKNDPNAPPASRMPLPELRDVDKAEKVKALREMFRRQNLSPDTLPSIIYYTVLNASASPSAVEVCDDSSMLALGFTNAEVKIWSLTPQKLKGLKSSDSLDLINRDADDVLVRMLDESTAEGIKTLCGHNGAVYDLSFSPDRTLLLSCSEDGTIRLWSLQTWTCLVNYKAHLFPVWQVKFSNHGHFFVSCGHDKTVRLWSTDHSQCLRVFVGHYSGVDCVAFHPNSNYVASGSSDRSIRLWDCVHGDCVRLMTGHKATVTTLIFSYDGRFLASGSYDNHVLLWDVAHGHLLGDFSHHTAMITSLCFSRCNNVLASGSLDGSITLWNFQKFSDDCNLEEVNVTHNPLVRTDTSNIVIATFRTRDSPCLCIHFSRRNLMYAVGSSEV